MRLLIALIRPRTITNTIIQIDNGWRLNRPALSVGSERWLSGFFDGSGENYKTGGRGLERYTAQ